MTAASLRCVLQYCNNVVYVVLCADEETQDQTVSILVDNAESIVQFIDGPAAEEVQSNLAIHLLTHSITCYHMHCILYNTGQRHNF